jgi:putative membrane protein
MSIIIRWIINALSLMLVAYILPNIGISGFYIALVTALILGLINAFIRPFLIFVTLPINVLTLGLFTFVINALLFWFVASFVEGFTVDGFWAAFFGALIFSIVSALATGLIGARNEKTV